jgi:hypothetical protein
MASFDLYDDYLRQKGPLSDQEQLLKELLLRETHYKLPGLTFEAVAGVSTAPTNPDKPGIVAQPGGTISELGTVKPGDLITADFFNGIVKTMNQIIAYLRYQSAAASAPTPPPSQPAAAGAGIAGALKDVAFSAVDAEDKVTVTFPAQHVNPSDFSDLLVGNTRIDPSALVKVAGGYSFKIDKDAYTAGMDVRAVSKGGASALQVVALFK